MADKCTKPVSVSLTGSKLDIIPVTLPTAFDGVSFAFITLLARVHLLLTLWAFCRPWRPNYVNRKILRILKLMWRMVAAKHAPPVIFALPKWLVWQTLSHHAATYLAWWILNARCLGVFMNISGYQINGPFEGTPSKIEFSIGNEIFTTIVAKEQKTKGNLT